MATGFLFQRGVQDCHAETEKLNSQQWQEAQQPEISQSSTRAEKNFHFF